MNEWTLGDTVALLVGCLGVLLIVVPWLSSRAYSWVE